MKKFSASHIFPIALALLALTGNLRAESSAITNPPVEFQVWAGEKAVVVHAARTLDAPFAGREWNYGGPYAFANLEFTAPFTVKIQSPRNLRQTVLRPNFPDVKLRVLDDHTVLVEFASPRKISVEPDGRRGALLLFADVPEANPPQPDAPGVVYFAPGIHRPEKILLTNNQTLYLAPGALVKGGIVANGENIRIAGRGILDSSDWPWCKGPTGRVVNLRGTNLNISGITILGACHWTIDLRDCRRVTIRDVNICGARVQNDDGIDVCNSQDVLMENCFIRTDDDCIALKGLDRKAANLNVERVVVKDCILWCDRARAVLLGHEGRCDFMRGITLTNLDIIHFAMTPFLLEPGENMKLEDVTVENIRVNGEGQSEFIRLRPTVNEWMKTPVPGHIADIRFRNVTLSGSPGNYLVQLFGHDEAHAIRDVLLENLVINGEKLTNGSPRLQIGAAVSGLSLKP